jgi:hypothetical protein
MMLPGSASPPSGFVSVSLENYLLMQRNDNSDLVPYLISGVVSWDNPPTTLADLKLKIIDRLDKKMVKFLSQGQGISRYTDETRIVLQGKAIRFIAVLVDPLSTQQQKDTANAKLAKVLQVLAWIDSVYDLRNTIKTQINACTTKQQVRNVDLSFASLNASDPQITPEDV